MSQLRKSFVNLIVRTYPLINITKSAYVTPYSWNDIFDFSHRNDILKMAYSHEILLFREDRFFHPTRYIMETILRPEIYSYSAVKFSFNESVKNINDDVNNLIPLKYMLFFNNIYKFEKTTENNKKNIFLKKEDLF